MKSLSTGRVLKPSSLLLCVQMNEPEKVFKSRVWNSVESENSSSVNIWDYSDAEDTPTSYWSTLPNWYFTIIFLFMFMFVFFFYIRNLVLWMWISWHHCAGHCHWT
jgi:hypothetical protein